MKKETEETIQGAAAMLEQAAALLEKVRAELKASPVVEATEQALETDGDAAWPPAYELLADVEDVLHGLSFGSNDPAERGLRGAALHLRRSVEQNAEVTR